MGNSKVAALTDLNGREFWILAVLAAAVLLVGIWPAPLLKIMEPTIHHLVDQAVASKIPSNDIAQPVRTCPTRS